MAHTPVRYVMLAILLSMSSFLQAQSTLLPFSSTTGGTSYSAQGNVMLWSSLDGGAASIVDSNSSQMRSSFLLAVPFASQLSGTVDLMSILGSPSQVAATAVLRQNGQIVNTIPLSLGAQGQYALEIPDDGNYNILFQAPHWLRKAQTVELYGELPGVNVQLANGDADGDNQVNLFDFVQLDINFGKTNVPMADLDMDGYVTLFDYVIIDMFFGSQGDN
ncbi:MAG: hypothetical protein ACYC1M_11045 [Armatimonadota bacterium]